MTDFSEYKFITAIGLFGGILEIIIGASVSSIRWFIAIGVISIIVGVGALVLGIAKYSDVKNVSKYKNGSYYVVTVKTSDLETKYWLCDKSIVPGSYVVCEVRLQGVLYKRLNIVESCEKLEWKDNKCNFPKPVDVDLWNKYSKISVFRDEYTFFLIVKQNWSGTVYVIGYVMTSDVDKIGISNCEFKSEKYESDTKILQFRKITINELLSTNHEFIIKEPDFEKLRILDTRTGINRIKPTTEPRKTNGYVYVNHCWNCKKHLDSTVNQRCDICRFLICPNCGACFCGFEKDREEKRKYKRFNY